MRTKLWRLCTMALLIVGSLGISATPTLAAGQGNCADDDWQNWHVGMANVPTAGSINQVSGIMATMELHNGLCVWSTTEASNDRGAAAWIGIQPYDINGALGNGKLAQIGILRCYFTDTGSSGHACNTYQTQSILFWAAGGCNGYGLEPHYIGPANAASYRMKLVMEAGNVLAGYIIINGVWTNVVNFDFDTNARVNCWSGQKTMAPVDFERFDQGDSYGDVNNWARASDILWQRPGFTGWQSPGYDASATCKQHRGTWHYPMANGYGTQVKCDVIASDEFWVWNSP